MPPIKFPTFLGFSIRLLSFAPIFSQNCIGQCVSLGKNTLSLKLWYLLRNPILQSSFLFPWSETSFPGVSSMNQTQKCRCSFSRAMSSNNNTYMLISGLSSQPGAPGRRPAAPSIQSGWMRQRLPGRRWAGKVGWGRGSFQTLWNLLVSDANEMEGAKRQNNMQEKMDTKEGREGIWPPKAAPLLWFPQQKWVSITGVCANNVSPQQVGIMFVFALPSPPSKSTAQTPKFSWAPVTTLIWLVTARHPVICQFSRMSKSQTMWIMGTKRGMAKRVARHLQQSAE